MAFFYWGQYIYFNLQLLISGLQNAAEWVEDGRRWEKNAQSGNINFTAKKYSLETFFVIVKLNSSWINWWIWVACLLQDLRESLGSTEEYTNTVAGITITTTNVRVAEEMDTLCFLAAFSFASFQMAFWEIHLKNVFLYTLCYVLTV